MHEKEYTVKVKSTNDKLHKYKYKHIFGVSFEDLIQEFGIETACKLIKFYGRTTIYIPSSNGLKRRIEEEQIRELFNHYKSDGATNQQVIEYLGRAFGFSERTIRKKLGKLAFTNGDKEIFKLKRKADKKLIALISENIEIFQRYGLVKFDTDTITNK